MATKSIEQKFRKLSEVEHCLLRPGRYIGSIAPHTAVEYVPSDSQTVPGAQPAMERREVTYNPGFLKLFDEVISNSADHSKRPEGKNLDIIRVDVDQAKGEISVYDNGGIPVVKHEEYDQYIPEMIFELRAGSNFDDSDESTLTGQNGEGAALTCIFSTKFRVETCDGKNRFLMTFTDNSQGGRTPKVEAAKEAKGFTRITYVPDFEKLGMAGIDDDNLAMLRARVFEVAATNTHLKVYWNGTRIMTRSFKDYIEMFTGTDGEYAFDDGESFKVGVAKSEDGFQHTSFVNTSRTKIGGTHVQYIVNQIVEGLRTHIEKKAKVSVKPSDIRNHLHLFIDATIVNPRYSSQTKDELITEPSAYGRGWSCPDKLIQKLLKTSVIQSVLDWVEAKQLAEKNKALRDAAKGADKSDPRRIEKFSDAAERHQRVKCVLFLSEGDTIFEDEELFIYRDGSFIKIKIKDVRLGDLVLTHLNRLKPVLDISRKVIEGVSIRTKYGDLIVSPEHKLIVYEVDSRQFKNVRAKNLSASNHKLVRSRAIEASLGKFTVTGSGDCKLSIKLDIEQYGELFVSKTHKIYVWNTDGYFEFVECQHLNPAKHLITLKNELSV